MQCVKIKISVHQQRLKSTLAVFLDSSLPILRYYRGYRGISHRCVII